MTRVYTANEVELHNSAESCWIIYQGQVYDVTGFVADHPGGQDILLTFAGTDITTVLSDATVHTHSASAYDLLDEYCIGKVVEQSNGPLGAQSGDSKQHTTVDVQKQSAQLGHERDQQFLNLNEPLFPQLWRATYSKAFYLEQVHRPRYTSHYVPYFSDPILDVLSRTTWYTIPMVWLPFILYQIWRSLEATNSSVQNTAYSFFFGVFSWSLLEYGLHRFLFHIDDILPDHPIALLLHFTLHGIHHHMPMDRLRLVMPPALTVVISMPIFKLANTLFVTTTAHAFMAGAFFGYVCYDLTHYYLHHSKVFKVHFREMKRYHLAHHYKNYESGFGITSKIWDYVFGTVLDDSL
ncbi:hypothetical protein BC940DRAFT_252656, partial [Gongronella butleri]